MISKYRGYLFNTLIWYRSTRIIYTPTLREIFDYTRECSLIASPGYHWQETLMRDAHSKWDSIDAKLSRRVPRPRTGYVTYMAFPGSRTMRGGEWASSAPPCTKTLGRLSLEKSSITIQTRRMVTGALCRFYFLKYRPCWHGIHALRRDAFLPKLSSDILVYPRIA